MGVRFTTMGPSARSAIRKERLLFFGGSTLMFALTVFGALLVYSQTVVQAQKDLVVEPVIDDEISLGMISLIAPATRIPKGTKITAQYLREVEWPRDQVPEGSLRHVQDIDGMFATSALSANQPILRSTVSPNPPSFGIGELLPAGHRAVSIQVDAISGVEGWATPGAHVDVYLTYFDSKEQVQKTRVAVEDAVVLSYGGSAKKSSNPELERKSVATTVTLAVALKDSLKIQTARAMGTITLALRNATDITHSGATEFSADDWDRKNDNKVPQSNSFVSKGFARYTDGKGTDKQFVLGGDDKWWISQGDEG